MNLSQKIRSETFVIYQTKYRVSHISQSEEFWSDLIQLMIHESLLFRLKSFKIFDSANSKQVVGIVEG